MRPGFTARVGYLALFQDTSSCHVAPSVVAIADSVSPGRTVYVPIGFGGSGAVVGGLVSLTGAAGELCGVAATGVLPDLEVVLGVKPNADELWCVWCFGAALTVHPARLPTTTAPIVRPMVSR